MCGFGAGAGWLVGSVPVGLQTSVVFTVGGVLLSRVESVEAVEGAIGGSDRIREYIALGLVCISSPNLCRGNLE